MTEPWVLNGKTVLVSNPSIGPTHNTWPAGPQLGREAEALYQKHEQDVRRSVTRAC